MTGGFVSEEYGANHASVANSTTGTTLSGWVKIIERRAGDLR